MFGNKANWVYCPKSGSRIIQNGKLPQVEYGNKSRHIIGHKVDFVAAKQYDYWRKEAKEMASDIAFYSGGTAIDNQGIVSIILPARHGNLAIASALMFAARRVAIGKGIPSVFERYLPAGGDTATCIQAGMQDAIVRSVEWDKPSYWIYDLKDKYEEELTLEFRSSRGDIVSVNFPNGWGWKVENCQSLDSAMMENES